MNTAQGTTIAVLTLVAVVSLVVSLGTSWGGGPGLFVWVVLPYAASAGVVLCPFRHRVQRGVALTGAVLVAAHGVWSYGVGALDPQFNEFGWALYFIPGFQLALCALTLVAVCVAWAIAWARLCLRRGEK